MTTYFTPTDAIKRNISRGLALKYKYGRGLAEVEKSRKVLKDEVNLTLIKSLYSELKKPFEKRLAPDGGPLTEYIDFLCYGGTAAQNWTTSILQEKNIVKSNTKVITEKDTNGEDISPWSKTPVTKAVDEEQKLATFVVLEPMLDETEFDLHGDYYDEQTVMKACHNFNQFSMKANFLHLIETNSFIIVESYITPVEIVLGEQFVKKGTWLATIKVIDDDIWEGIKDGTFNGLSIGAVATTEYLDED